MKGKRKFIPAQFVELTEELRNPERGWYQIFTFDLEREPDLAGTKGSLEDGETAALLRIGIGAYRACSLDDRAFKHLDEIFSFFVEQGKDLILRICYDYKGKGMETDPDSFDRVLEHMGQMKGCLQKYRDNILMFQGMLVGSWGEMHGSRYLSPAHLRRMRNVLLDSADGIFLGVRRPVQWRILQGENCWGDGEIHIGLYDDGILGSSDDLGTFGRKPGKKAGWEMPWDLFEELEFEDWLCRMVPQVGEAVYEEGHETSSTLEQDVQRLKTMHLSCLNCRHDPRLLSLWKSWVWKDSGVWNGINGFDYIGRHLGYRFCIRKVEAGYRLRGLQPHLILTVWIENTGFAGFYHQGEVWLIVDKTGGERLRLKTDWDIRLWQSGQSFSCSWEIPEEADRIYLAAYRAQDQQRILFANPSTSEGQVFLGRFS